jgi:hypothetical protein
VRCDTTRRDKALGLTPLMDSLPRHGDVAHLVMEIVISSIGPRPGPGSAPRALNQRRMEEAL